MGERTNSTNNNAEAKPTEKTAEQIRIEFYKTYDVMTGVRIAATLGGFFGLMVLLVVYKTKCKSRTLSEENIEATVAAAVVEEEQYTLEYAHEFYRRHIPHHHGIPLKGTTRFSSVGGGYNMYTPPVRLNYSMRGRVSLPTTSPYVYPNLFPPRHHLMDSPPPKVFREVEEDFELYGRSHQFLRVPSSRRSSRRLSSITCSSCDTSYLERRGSAMEMGRPIPPPFISSNKSDRLEEEPWDFYYPIDIQVIQPTPDISPAESQISVYDCKTHHRATLCVPRSVAPLASISSCRLPSIENDSHSVGSDSVFLDEELIDTEDEVDEFSTDSDADNLECNIPSKSSITDVSKNIPMCSKQLKDHSRVYRVPTRRFSSPNAKLSGVSYFQQFESANDNKRFLSTFRLVNNIKNYYKTSSDSDTIHVSRSLDKQLSSCGETSKNIPRTSMSASCDHLVKALQEHSSQGDVTLKVVEHCTWSQETLF